LNEEQLKQRLHYNNEKRIFIPNEILIDLPNNKNIQNGIHISFSYAYYYLISYIYRYAKYGQSRYQQGDLKEILGYASKYKKLDYLIKKDGVMDAMWYTCSNTDFPVVSEVVYDEGKGKVVDVEFTMYSELKEMYQEESLRNYKIKVPVKGLYRDKESEDDDYLNGTFFEVDNTHGIDPLTFIKCMANESIGCVGFYLYGYLKRHCDMYNSYDVSYEELVKGTGVANTTLNRYLIQLAKHNFITVNRQDFIVNLPIEQREPNSYQVNDVHEIVDVPEEINTRVVSFYMEKDSKKNTWGNTVNW
jgi:hypothetical protein